MKKSGPIHLIVILLVVGLATYFLWDSFVYYSKSRQARNEYVKTHPNLFKRIINLGLDLQGGMRLVLEIDRSELSEDAKKDVLDRAYTIIQNRVDGLGVAEPSIQKQGDNRIVVELPGLQNEQAAKQVIGSTAQLEFKLLREPGELSRAISIIDNVVKGESTDTTATEQADTTGAEAQQEAQQLFEAEGETDTADTIEGLADVQSFSSLLVGSGEQIAVPRRNRAKVTEILRRDDVRQALERAGLGGNQFLWGHEIIQQGATEVRPLYYLKARPELKGDAIDDARASLGRSGFQEGQAIVELEMTRSGARVFSRVTGRNVNKFLAIVLDSTVYSAPRIRQKISAGRAQIEGNFSMEEAKNLAVVLRAGALPAPAEIVEERTVGPSLGQDSIRLGMIAFLTALGLVALFMIVYYKLSGVIAAVAMTLNLLFVFAIMAGLSATLTLPGIAGLVLIIGMSVDANVLVFERIREELKIGKTVRSAIDSGYHRAFQAILDSNVTTLITGFILYQVGTGPIKGFAITLMFGLIANFFTAVYGTRVVFNLMTGGATKKETLSI